MEPVQKKQKLVLEECELIIEVNKKGECSFDVMSKVETVCNGKTLDFSANSKNGDNCIKNDENKTVSCIDMGNATDGNDDSGGKKGDNNDFVDKIPPKSKYVALDCEFVGVLQDISALGKLFYMSLINICHLKILNLVLIHFHLWKRTKKIIFIWPRKKNYLFPLLGLTLFFQARAFIIYKIKH